MRNKKYLYFSIKWKKDYFLEKHNPGMRVYEMNKLVSSF